MILRLLGLVPDRRQVRRFALLSAIVIVVRAATVLLLFPLLSAAFGDDPGAAWPWLGALAAAVVLGWACERRLGAVAWDIGFILLEGVERDVLDRVHRLPLAWLDTRRRTRIQLTLTKSGHELGTNLAYVVSPAIAAIGSTVLVALGLLVISPWLGITALAAAAVLVVALWGAARIERRGDAAYAEAAADANAAVVELAQRQATLRAAGRAVADSPGAGVGAALQRQRAAGVRQLLLSVPGQLLFSIAAQAALLGLAGVAAVLAVRGDLEAADVVALVVVIARVIEPYTSLAGLAPALETMRGSLERVQEVLDAPALAEPAASAAPDPSAPAVELRNVRFAHDGVTSRVTPVLDGVDLTVPRGSTTAIVGPSGAGKSTLLSLIARFADVQDGSVRVCGHDVRDYVLDDLAGLLGIVFQQVYLFDTTLRENIRLGRPGADDEDVFAAARAAQLDEVVARLPEGWDTRVGEGGESLSGGERQRVSIARALLKGAPVLLLDEVTSAVDSATEQALVGALDHGAAERATVIVAHRLGTIARADQVIFLEHGRIVERGTPAELLDRGGRFADFWYRRDRATGWSLEQSPRA